MRELWWVNTTTLTAPSHAKVLAMAQDLPGNIPQAAAQLGPVKLVA